MTAPIRVSLLESGSDQNAYSDFLDRHTGATLYHSLNYRDIVLEITGAIAEYALAWQGNDVVGAMPLMVRLGRLGEVLNSLPFFGSYGGILADHADAAYALAEWFASRLDKSGVAAATVVQNPFDRSFQLPKADLCDERIAQWTDLTGGPDFSEILMERIAGSARRNIRHARAVGVEVTINNNAFDFLEDCHRQNMEEVGGRTKPPQFFTAVPRHMLAGRDFRLYVARHSSDTVAALLMFYFKGFAEYIMPVTLKDRRSLQPTAAILHRAMCDAHADGKQIWNWGGTWLSQDGVYRFKRKWGALETRYAYCTYIRDRGLLANSAASLGDGYPFFYIAPFHLLKGAPRA